MNDLERDLHDLLQDKAGSIDTPQLAPPGILRRGRRRQIRTVATSSLAGVLAIVVAVATLGNLRAPDAPTPAGPSPLPARTTTIGGVPVTAPAGWTLVDDWPLAALLPSSTESCTFTGTATAVDESGNPIEPTSPQPETSPSCSSAPSALPAGVPVLQLANFDIPLGETVCGLAGDPPADLPASGVAVYVAKVPGGISSKDFQVRCPGAENVTDGDFLTTFADRTVEHAYVAVMVQGPAASSEDAHVGADLMQSLGGIRIDPTAAGSVPGPGYVLAAGTSDRASWRLEAGLTWLGSTTNQPPIGATLVRTNVGSEVSRSVPASSSNAYAQEHEDLGADGVVQWGTAGAGVTGLDIVAASGTRTPATLVPWPSALASTEGVQLPQGSIWFAIVPASGDVEFTRAGTPVETPSRTTSLTTAALDYRTEGTTIVATGNDLGHEWELRIGNGQLLPTVDGTEQGSFVLPKQGGFQLDVGGGTFLFSREPNPVDGVIVTADASGDQLVADGRWLPAGFDEKSGRVWFVVLAGEGTGYERVQGQLPAAISWPTWVPPRPGQVISAGSDDSTSWALRWTDQNCPAMDVVFSVHEGDTGTGDCAIPYDGSDPFVGGFYGRTDAVVIVTGPEDMLCTVDDPTGQVPGGLSGGTVASVGPWGHTGSCILTVPVGDTVTVHLTNQAGHPILGQLGVVTITAKRGSLTLG